MTDPLWTPTALFVAACWKQADEWHPAHYGTAEWTRYRDGNEYLYVFNTKTGRHGFLGRDDVVISDHDFYTTGAGSF